MGWGELEFNAIFQISCSTLLLGPHNPVTDTQRSRAAGTASFQVLYLRQADRDRFAFAYHEYIEPQTEPQFWSL